MRWHKIKVSLPQGSKLLIQFVPLGKNCKVVHISNKGEMCKYHSNLPIVENVPNLGDRAGLGKCDSEQFLVL